MLTTVRTVKLETDRLNVLSGDLESVFVVGDEVFGTVLSCDDEELSFYLPLRDNEAFEDIAEVGPDLVFINYVGTVMFGGAPLHFVERLTVPASEFEEC